MFKSFVNALGIIAKECGGKVKYIQLISRGLTTEQGEKGGVGLRLRNLSVLEENHFSAMHYHCYTGQVKRLTLAGEIKK